MKPLVPATTRPAPLPPVIRTVIFAACSILSASAIVGSLITEACTDPVWLAVIAGSSMLAGYAAGGRD